MRETRPAVIAGHDYDSPREINGLCVWNFSKIPQSPANIAALACVVYRPRGRGPDMGTGVACCRECGEPIPEARLRVVPDAERCRKCQEAMAAAYFSGWLASLALPTISN